MLSQLQLLEHAWDLDYEHRSNVVEVYIRYLREKIDRPFGVKSLETVRGFGYRLRRTGAREPAADPRPADAGLRAGDGASCSPATAVFVYLRQQSDLDDDDRPRAALALE